MIATGSLRVHSWTKNADGFTLVEMLVAVALIGLLSLGLASAMGLGVKTWNSSGTLSEQLDAARAVQITLRKVLGSIYPEWTAKNPAYVDFSGSSDEMEFTSRAPQALGHPGFARFNLAVVESNGISSLFLRVRSDTGPSNVNAPITDTVLLSGMKTIEFSYFGPGETSQTQVWQPRWRTRSELPHLIRIEAAAEGKAAALWPPLIVNPAIDVDVSCEFDPLSRRCRGR